MTQHVNTSPKIYNGKWIRNPFTTTAKQHVTLVLKRKLWPLQTFFLPDMEDHIQQSGSDSFDRNPSGKHPLFQTEMWNFRNLSQRSLGQERILAMLKAMQGFRLQAANNFKTGAEYYFFQYSFYLKVTSLLSSNSQKPSAKAKRSVVSSVCKAKFNWDLGRSKMLQEMVELVKTVNIETWQCFP